jgi:membrane protease YdiL (CAAX protease family)
MSAPRRPVAMFLVLVLVASLPFYALLNLSGGRGEGMRLYVTGLMWCPAAAALLACRWHRFPLQALGWHWPAGRFAAAALLLPLAYGGLAYALAWSTGLGGFSLAEYSAWSGRMLGLAQWPPAAHVALMLALQLSAGLVLSCATALGEEIGWRGLLSPALSARLGFLRGNLATGLLWSLWHWPVLFWMNFDGATPRAFAMACFTTSLVALSVVYGWFRERTGSLWPAVLLHASHNVLITPVFSRMTVGTGATAYAIDEFGFLLAAVSVALAIAFARRPLTPSRPSTRPG